MREPSYTMDQAAAMLNIGRNTLFAILREEKVLNHENFPNRYPREQGYLATRPMQITIRSTGITKYVSKTVVTNKGIEWLCKVLNQHEQKKADEKTAKRNAAKRENYQRKKAEKQAWKFLLTKPWKITDEPDYRKI